MRDHWWTWRWDRVERRDLKVGFARVTRWRRGSLLTVYRMEFAAGGVQWWFYGPFNLCIGFGRGSSPTVAPPPPPVAGKEQP